MTVTVHSTDRIIEVECGLNCRSGFQARVWEGETESGIKVQMLVPRIAALATEDLSQFDRELKEQQAPTAQVQAWPLWMIL